MEDKKDMQIKKQRRKLFSKERWGNLLQINNNLQGNILNGNPNSKLLSSSGFIVGDKSSNVSQIDNQIKKLINTIQENKKIQSSKELNHIGDNGQASVNINTFNAQNNLNIFNGLNNFPNIFNSVNAQNNFGGFNNLNNNINMAFSNLQKNTITLRFLQQNYIFQPFNQNYVEIDWTRNVGSIRDQGTCGGCYAFATADALSSMNSIYKYKNMFVPLSVQQIIDCSNNGLTLGCNGGFLQGAFTHIQTNGITTEYQYPYKGKQSITCNIQKGPFKVSSFRSIRNSCNTIIQELKKKPIPVAIAGFHLRFYSSGIFDQCTNIVDHAVLLIGYVSGIEWKIKNSWGSDWGYKGFAWIKQGNTCGICTNAVSANIPEEYNYRY